MSAGDEAGNVEKLDWYGAFSIITAAVIRLAFCLKIKTGTCAVDLEVAYGSLGVDGCESSRL